MRIWWKTAPEYTTTMSLIYSLLLSASWWVCVSSVNLLWFLASLSVCFKTSGLRRDWYRLLAGRGSCLRRVPKLRCASPIQQSTDLIWAILLLFLLFSYSVTNNVTNTSNIKVLRHLLTGSPMHVDDGVCYHLADAALPVKYNFFYRIILLISAVCAFCWYIDWLGPAMVGWLQKLFMFCVVVSLQMVKQVGCQDVSRLLSNNHHKNEEVLCLTWKLTTSA